MTENVSSSGNELVDSVHLKIESLTTLLSEIQHPSNNYEFDPSICNDIYAYINIVRTDCQKLLNNNKYHLFSNKEHAIRQTDVSKPIHRVYKNDHYNEEMQRFENEIDSRVDEVIKSIQTNVDILNARYKEKSLLEEQTNDIYRKLNFYKNTLNNEIDKSNNTNMEMENEFYKWKERIKENNDTNILLINEAHKLIDKYQQKMIMVKNNVMNLVESALKSFTLRVECFKLEIRIIWEGNRILKMYKNIDKLIAVNDQKLDCYNDLQFQMGNINNEINKDLDYIMRANSKFKSQIQLHNDVKEIAEEKFRQMCLLNNEIREIEELLVNDQEYLNSIEIKIRENETEIARKRQQIEDENIKNKNLKIDFENKNKLILDTRNLIEQKQSQLKEIESRNEEMSKELENAKLEFQRKQKNVELMQCIMDHQERETREKIQYYHNNIIQPLELKLEKSIALVDYEIMRNDELKTSAVIGFSPEFQKIIDDVNSRISQLDKTLGAQRETMEKLKDNFRCVQTDVIRELDAAMNKSEKYMDTFQTIINYKTKMASNAEIKQKCSALECELFQKRYELKKKREKSEEEENQLTSQLHELKQMVRQQAVYNKELSRRYVQLRK